MKFSDLERFKIKECKDSKCTLTKRFASQRRSNCSEAFPFESFFSCPNFHCSEDRRRQVILGDRNKLNYSHIFVKEYVVAEGSATEIVGTNQQIGSNVSITSNSNCNSSKSKQDSQQQQKSKENSKYPLNQFEFLFHPHYFKSRECPSISDKISCIYGQFCPYYHSSLEKSEYIKSNIFQSVIRQKFTQTLIDDSGLIQNNFKQLEKLYDSMKTNITIATPVALSPAAAAAASTSASLGNTIKADPSPSPQSTRTRGSSFSSSVDVHPPTSGTNQSSQLLAPVHPARVIYIHEDELTCEENQPVPSNYLAQNLSLHHISQPVAQRQPQSQQVLVAANNLYQTSNISESMSQSVSSSGNSSKKKVNIINRGGSSKLAEQIHETLESTDTSQSSNLKEMSNSTGLVDSHLLSNSGNSNGNNNHTQVQESSYNASEESSHQSMQDDDYRPSALESLISESGTLNMERSFSRVTDLSLNDDYLQDEGLLSSSIPGINDSAAAASFGEFEGTGPCFTFQQKLQIEKSECVEMKHSPEISSCKVQKDIQAYFKTQKYGEYICGFLNHHGGILYIGVDENGVVQGMSLSRKQKDWFNLHIDLITTQFEPKLVVGEVRSSFIHVVYKKSQKPLPCQSNTYVIVLEIVKASFQEVYFFMDQAFTKKNVELSKMDFKQIKLLLEKKHKKQKKQEAKNIFQKILVYDDYGFDGLTKADLEELKKCIEDAAAQVHNEILARSIVGETP